MIVPEV